ncbi:hypothetical protein [Floccifex sp.]|uniref:hypothetical protein n=1 Tax=Floccifex sp. TaxID=2815810 RepID=UPI003F04289A
MEGSIMSSQNKIPEWIIQCLDQYGNCACGRSITKKLGKDKLLEILEQLGHPCTLEILSEKEEAYPVDGTYILTLKNRELLEDDE